MEQGGYILISTVLGKALEVSYTLHRHDWVKSVERMVGAYDIIVMTRAGVGPIAEGMVRDVIEQIDGVVRVAVCPLTCDVKEWKEVGDGTDRGVAQEA